jgi:protein-disulfide isomerase
MKRILILLAALACASCNAAPAGSNAALQQKVDSLTTQLTQLKTAVNWMAEKGFRTSLEGIQTEIENANRVWDLELDSSPSLGNPKAPITIVEFTEFQCPYCARIAPYLDTLTKKYPDKIRLVYKAFPLSFHPNARPAAAAAFAAGKQGKFWEYRWALSPHYQQLNDSTFIEVAKQVGIPNIEQFKKDMVMTPETQAHIERDMALGVKVGVQGTPNFYVNGKRQDSFSPDLIEKMIKDLK